MANILAADDSPSIQQMVRFTLEAEGHDVVTVGDGSDALEEVKSGQFDLVITDINMPNMNGIEMIEAIKVLLHETDEKDKLKIGVETFRHFMTTSGEHLDDHVIEALLKDCADLQHDDNMIIEDLAIYLMNR